MEQKTVVKKGYTIEVTSSENDGDNYKTRSMTISSKELALAILQMCKDIFVSCSNGDGGIGNMMDDDYHDACGIIMNYVADKPILTEGLTGEDDIVNSIMDINYALMSSSDFYYSRVFENGTVFYSPEDINVEVIA